MKKALIFGVTGQDGSYLSEFLLEKKYQVHGVKRKSSSYNTDRINHIFENSKNFFLHYGDLTDSIYFSNIFIIFIIIIIVIIVIIVIFICIYI